jgi:hypothetical protein
MSVSDDRQSVVDNAGQDVTDVGVLDDDGAAVFDVIRDVLVDPGTRGLGQGREQSDSGSNPFQRVTRSSSLHSAYGFGPI